MSIPVTVLAVLAGANVSDIGREEARRAAARELSEDIYHRDDPGLVLSVLYRLAGWITRALRGMEVVTPGGWLGLAAIMAVLVLLAILIRVRAGPAGRSHRRRDPLLSGRALTSGDHRAKAERHAAGGQWAEALRERLRAIARAMEERAILETRPGRTADEFAAEAGAVLPRQEEHLQFAVRAFDDVWYGGRIATPQMYEQLCDLDSRLSAAKPALAGNVS